MRADLRGGGISTGFVTVGTGSGTPTRTTGTLNGVLVTLKGGILMYLRGAVQ